MNVVCCLGMCWSVRKVYYECCVLSRNVLVCKEGVFSVYANQEDADNGKKIDFEVTLLYFLKP